MPFSRAAALLGLAATLGNPLHAQARLEATDTFPEPFSRIVGLHELSDGRVIVADRLEQHVSYLDFDSGSIKQIGREGEGPGEYQQPLGLLPQSDDGTLLTDIGNMRLSLIDRSGAIEKSWPMMQQGADGTMSFIRPTAADAAGLVYYGGSGVVMRTRGGSPPAASSDSSHIIRLDLARGVADTLTSLYAEPVRAGGSGSTQFSTSGGSIRMAGGMFRPFPVADEWGVAPDGKIAVARASEYRIDWFYPDGTVRIGSPVSYTPVPVGRAEKEQWADSQSNNSVAMMVGGGGGGGGGRSFQIPRPDIDEVEFPEVMPPFGRNAVSVSPNGDVWVTLNQSAGDTEPLFDVFDSSGQKIKQVQLPPNRQLVGFGMRVLYAVAVDEDDLQWLERYPYP